MQSILFLHYKLQQWLTLTLVTVTITTEFAVYKKCLWKLVLYLGDTGQVQRDTLLKNHATAEMLSSQSLSLHTISQTTHAVQAWTLRTNALENFIWLRHCPKIRLGWWNCKRTQEELSGSIQGANTSTRSKGSKGRLCMAQTAGEESVNVGTAEAAVI